MLCDIRSIFVGVKFDFQRNFMYIQKCLWSSTAAPMLVAGFARVHTLNAGAASASRLRLRASWLRPLRYWGGQWMSR